MPVIVSKSVSINLCYVQARRIECLCCQRPFCYVLSDTSTVQVQGAPYAMNPEPLRRKAMTLAEERLQKVAKKPKLGEAACPHCKQYQPWMVLNSHRKQMGWGGVIGVVIGAGLYAANAIWELSGKLDSGEALLGLAGLGLAAGLTIGKVRSINKGPHNEEDHRAFPDENFLGLAAQCMEREQDPILTWFTMLGGDPGDHAMVSLGFKDEVEPPLISPSDEPAA